MFHQLNGKFPVDNNHSIPILASCGGPGCFSDHIYDVPHSG